tara:strand:- start:33269 stop:33643 length:375 start_codon:yes stop_codon:yes gene_type:complete
MWGKISLTAFFISLLSLTLLSLGIYVGIPYWLLFYVGVIAFGILGFISSILSNFFDKRKRKINKMQSIIFYVGMILVFAGLMFRFMHWPFQRILLFAGIGVSTISFFIPKPKEETKDELLDSDL